MGYLSSIMSPVIGIKKPAPAAISISLILIVKFSGLPTKLGSSERDFCVLAMQIGKSFKPKSAIVLRFFFALEEYSTWLAP